MKKRRFSKSTIVPVPVERLWDWHMTEGAFERLVPPWQRVELVERPEGMSAGSTVLLRLHAGFLKRDWRARIESVEANRQFVDIQEKGPFGFWRHEHRMEATGENSSRLTDTIDYALPMGLGIVPGMNRLADNQLERLFQFRHQQMRFDLERYPELSGAGRTVLVTGASGLVGRRLVPFLKTLGYQVHELTRGPAGPQRFNWDPDRQILDSNALKDVHAVIHLAGANIAAGRWTDARRKAILESRTNGTRTLVEAIKQLANPPEVLISSSGVNFYETDGQPKDEASAAGSGFLSEVCRQWEDEAMQAEKAGVRTVCLRTAVVLDPSGGAVGRMLLPFQLGLGGPVGTGKQGFPWIGMDDLLDIFIHLMESGSVSGPVNAVHPQCQSQGAFSKCLGTVLGRPSFLPLPAAMVRLLFGRMGEETLLANLNIRPGVLQSTGYRFRFETLEATLRHILGP
ncbi:MAG: TIGR01777 family oxidoreductase [Puniceicoccaceae bacterium]